MIAETDVATVVVLVVGLDVAVAVELVGGIGVASSVLGLLAKPIIDLAFGLTETTTPIRHRHVGGRRLDLPRRRRRRGRACLRPRDPTVASSRSSPCRRTPRRAMVELPPLPKPPTLQPGGSREVRSREASAGRTAHGRSRGLHRRQDQDRVITARRNRRRLSRHRSGDRDAGDGDWVVQRVVEFVGLQHAGRCQHVDHLRHRLAGKVQCGSEDATAHTPNWNGSGVVWNPRAWSPLKPS